MNTYVNQSKPYYNKRKEVKLFLNGDYIVRLTEANHKSVYYKEVDGDCTQYNVSFDMMIGIGYGSGVWKDSGKGFLEVTGTADDWKRFYSLVNRQFETK